jgi:hypothetical protein
VKEMWKKYSKSPSVPLYERGKINVTLTLPSPIEGEGYKRGVI